jgi:uncharacterized ParB-like nuclease family protein
VSDKPFGPSSTFGRARRREAYKRLADVVRRRKPKPLLDLGDVGKRLRVFEQSYVGIRPIPVARIVGTLGRSGDFNRKFLPRRGEIQSRWERVERAFDQGDFPPITVFELDGSYFVVDGHHRVAVARQRGIDYIDAEISRLRTRWPLPPDADLGRIIMEEQRRQFMEDSGLERARPEVRIEFSRPQGYIELLEQIKVHGHNLMMQSGEVFRRRRSRRTGTTGSTCRRWRPSSARACGSCSLRRRRRTCFCGSRSAGASCSPSEAGWRPTRLCELRESRAGSRRR